MVRYLIVFKTPNQKQEIDLTKKGCLLVATCIRKKEVLILKGIRRILELNKVAPFLSRSFHHLRNFSFMFNINSNNQKLRSRGRAEMYILLKNRTGWEFTNRWASFLKLKFSFHQELDFVCLLICRLVWPDGCFLCFASLGLYITRHLTNIIWSVLGEVATIRQKEKKQLWDLNLSSSKWI